MKLRWISLATLFPFGMASGAMTAAWKVPAEVFHSHLDQGSHARKLDKPPGSSSFFQPGDELWDLAPVLAKRDPITLPAVSDSSDPFAPSSDEATPEETTPEKIPAPAWGGEWVVWDARSEMLIARGTRNEVLAVERQLRLEDRPVQIRTKIEWVSRQPESTRSASLVSRSGEEARIDINGCEILIDGTISPSINVTDLNLTSTWPGTEKDTEWELKTAATFPDGERTLTARQGNCEIWTTVTMEGIDGTPLSKIRWIENGEKTEPWIWGYRDRFGQVESLDSDRAIGWFPEASRRIDGEMVKALTTASLVDAPAELHSRVHGRFFDLHSFVGKKMISQPTLDFFAGYDPLADMLVVVGTAADIGRIKEAFETEGSFCPPVNISLETNSAAGNWFILGHSGEEQSLTLNKDEKPLLSFEVQPEIAGSHNLADLSYLLNSPPAFLESSILLPRDKPTQVGEFKMATGDSFQVEFTGHWQEVYR